MKSSIKFYLLALNTPTIVEEVKSVSIPTKEGIITILPNHTNLITALEPGILILKKLNDEKDYYAILGGIGVISDNEIKIITNLFEKGKALPKEKEEFSQWNVPSIEVNKRLEEEIRYHLLKVIREWKAQKQK